MSTRKPRARQVTVKPRQQAHADTPQSLEERKADIERGIAMLRDQLAKNEGALVIVDELVEQKTAAKTTRAARRKGSAA